MSYLGMNFMILALPSLASLLLTLVGSYQRPLELPMPMPKLALAPAPLRALATRGTDRTTSTRAAAA